MATPFVKPGPNGVSSPGGSTPSRNRDWGALRSGEPGSAFRGLTKGRGGGADRGGGRGRGRGRSDRAGSGTLRGGRGGGDQANGTKPETTPAKFDTPAAAKPSPAAGPPTPSVEKVTVPAVTNEKTPRPKAPSRRASRNVPTLVLPPSTPTVETPLATAPSRQANRRKRSQQHGKSPVTTGSLKQGLSVVPSPSQNLLRPQRARTGPSSPIVPTKDAPPHLSAAPDVPNFDLKHNIDVLVERVRAVAMENNRPTTPGSHIDWAGDDDDSLPDLDDWGVTTSTSVAGDKTNDEISPILVDGLKPLPEPSEQLGDGREDRKVNVAPDSVDSVPKVADKVSPRNEKGKSQHTAHPPKALQLVDIAPEPINSSSTPQTTAQATAPSASPIKTSEPPSKVPLHPSLPAKPVAAVQSLAVQAKSRHGAMPMRVSVPVKQPVVGNKPAEPVEPPVPTVEEAPTFADPPLAIVERSLPAVVASEPSLQVVVAPPTAPEDDSSIEDSSDKLGLAASIHAPASLPELASLPIILDTLPTVPRAFNPTHQRAHTVGRTPPSNQLHTAPAFQQRFSRSGASTPQGGYGPHIHHGRTHSSPPSGSGLNPRVHSQRPIITGDAISRLARTIGGNLPPRPKEVSTAKE